MNQANKRTEDDKIKRSRDTLDKLALSYDDKKLDVIEKMLSVMNNF